MSESTLQAYLNRRNTTASTALHTESINDALDNDVLLQRLKAGQYGLLTMALVGFLSLSYCIMVTHNESDVPFWPFTHALVAALIVQAVYWRHEMTRTNASRMLTYSKERAKIARNAAANFTSRARNLPDKAIDSWSSAGYAVSGFFDDMSDLFAKGSRRLADYVTIRTGRARTTIEDAVGEFAYLINRFRAKNRKQALRRARSRGRRRRRNKGRASH